MTNPVVLYGTQSNGETLPVQVDATGRLVAEGLPGPQGEKGDQGEQGIQGPPGEGGITLPPDPEEGQVLGWQNGELQWLYVDQLEPEPPAFPVQAIDQRIAFPGPNGFGVFDAINQRTNPAESWDAFCRALPGWEILGNGVPGYGGLGDGSYRKASSENQGFSQRIKLNCEVQSGQVLEITVTAYYTVSDQNSWGDKCRMNVAQTSENLNTIRNSYESGIVTGRVWHTWSAQWMASRNINEEIEFTLSISGQTSPPYANAVMWYGFSNWGIADPGRVALDNQLRMAQELKALNS